MPGKAGSRELKAQAHEDQFQAALEHQHTLAVRTAEALRKMVLLGPDRTLLEKFPAGKVDPYVQLMLVARDEYEGAEDSNSKLGFFREMRAMYTAADAKVQAALELAMKERHHQDKMSLETDKSDPKKAPTLAGLIEQARSDVEEE